jgi:hypothetical protein
MADPSQLCGVGGAYVDNRMVSFHIYILNRDGMKEISIVIFFAVSKQDQKTSTKTTSWGRETRNHFLQCMFTIKRK